MIFIETIHSKGVRKFIKTNSTPNGHDCWGNTEWSSQDGVYINGKFETIFKGSYIAHDGEKAIYVGYISHLPNKIAEYLYPNLKEENKKKRYKEYLQLKKEFEELTPENTIIKRESNIENIIK